tara:strand:+ start:1656 stop:2507 length:852 start_codon:yes stop_codon:yes gene_type:complete
MESKAKSNSKSMSLLSSPLSTILSKHPFKKTYLQSFLPDFDPEEWKPLVRKMMRHYEKVIIKRGNKMYLPKGTKLYHGSLEYPFLPASKSKANTGRMTFFGLDIDISLWYILELIEMEKYKKTIGFNRFGFLYLFVVTQDIEIHKLIDLINDNPKEIRSCKKLGNVCLHPQVAFRGEVFNSPSIYKLSSELTLHYQRYEKHLKLDKLYIVDPLLLEMNKNDPKWKVRNSIIKRYHNLDLVETDLYEETIDAETYKRYYLGALGKKKKKKKKTKKKKKKKTKKK